MAYKVTNRSRQGIPVLVKEKGKIVQKDLSYYGENSKCTSEERTMSMDALERAGFIKINK